MLNKIFEIIRSNSLPEGNLLRVEDNEVIQVAMPMDSQLRNTTLIQDQVASTSGSTRSQSSAAPQETLHSQEPIASVTADTDEQFTDPLTVTEPLQPQATAHHHRVKKFTHCKKLLHLYTLPFKKSTLMRGT